MSFIVLGLNLLFVTPRVYAHLVKQKLAKPEEWIAIRSDIRVPWSEIMRDLPEFEFSHFFGPLSQYALLKSNKEYNKKWRGNLPRGLKDIQSNYTYQSFETSDPDFSKSWGLVNTGQDIPGSGKGTIGVDIGALNAWEVSTGDEKVIVAVLDSGIDLHHEDLQTNRWKNKLEIPGNAIDDDGNGFVDDTDGWNFVEGNANVMDDNNHGSFVSGIIGADSQNGRGTRGVAPHVRMLTVRMLDKNGTSTSERAVKAIEYAVKNGAQIINASWGGPNYDQALYDTIKWANDRGVLFVAAAGNEAKDNDVDEKPIYPATFHLPNIISVAAYDNQDNLARFSNYGKESVHLGAPGVGIYSTVVGGYKISEGTSFAAPHVSGVAALLKAVHFGLSVADLKKRLLESTTPLDYYSKERIQSRGRLNAYNALNDIRPPRTPVPTQWKTNAKLVSTSHPYANDTKQSFEFSSPGASHLRVHFTGFALERGYDFVTLWDKQGRLVNRYTGELGDFWSADAIGDSLKLEFKSDFSNNAYGFEIDAYQIAE